jgi:hypothetical protein
MIMRPLLLAAAFALTAIQPAAASCRSGNFRFTFGQSAPVNTVLTMTSASCDWSFGGGTYVTYESIAVTRRAANLTITPLSNGFGLNIRARNGFKGKDAFSLRTCGHFRSEKGCATINFDVTVQ